jgi:AcrR family transcriptional regulator
VAPIQPKKQALGYCSAVQNQTAIFDRNTHVPPKGLKSTQRDRLIAGVIAVANRNGYAGTNVSEIISHAGVSRPTFYEYFADKDDCFLAAHRDISRRLVEQIRHAVAEAPPERAPQAAIQRLLQRAEAEPGQARFLANEAMAGGPRALDERDHTIDQIEQAIEAARADTPPQTSSPDLPTRALIGATHWLLAPRLRRGERDLSELACEIIHWIESYERPCAEHRWRSLEPGPSVSPSPHVSELSPLPPPPLPSGRSRLSSAEIARNQRERIIFATADVAVAKGYTATTIADITAAARVDKRVFYSHFRDKQQAFLAVHELGSQQTMAVAASAFFSTASWPERIWEGIRAGAHFHATYHIISHIGFVESHAVGAPAVQRIDDSRAAFTIFLQEGVQYASRPPSRTVMEAIAAAIFEIGYRQARRGRGSEMARLACHATYVALAPFLGPQAANELIDHKLRESVLDVS